MRAHPDPHHAHQQLKREGCHYLFLLWRTLICSSFWQWRRVISILREACRGPCTLWLADSTGREACHPLAHRVACMLLARSGFPSAMCHSGCCWILCWFFSVEDFSLDDTFPSDSYYQTLMIMFGPMAGSVDIWLIKNNKNNK